MKNAPWNPHSPGQRNAPSSPIVPTQHVAPTKRILKNCPRKGFVLVMCLALLVLASTILVSVARLATQTTTQAILERNKLQQKWGQISINRAVLTRIDYLLNVQEIKSKQATPSLKQSIQLTNFQFDLTLADEQAKANLNAILEVANATRLQTRLIETLAGSGLINSIRLRPTEDVIIKLDRGKQTIPATSNLQPHLDGFGQVFDRTSLATLTRRMPGQSQSPIDLLTLWGDGSINARRASEAAILLASNKSLNTVEVGRLIDSRNRLLQGKSSMSIASPQSLTPGDAFVASIENLRSQSAKNKGNLALVTQSSCFSLTIVTRNTQRQWYDVQIIDQRIPDKPMIYSISD